MRGWWRSRKQRRRVEGYLVDVARSHRMEYTVENGLYIDKWMHFQEFGAHSWFKTLYGSNNRRFNSIRPSHQWVLISSSTLVNISLSLSPAQTPNHAPNHNSSLSLPIYNYSLSSLDTNPTRHLTPPKHTLPYRPSHPLAITSQRPRRDSTATEYLLHPRRKRRGERPPEIRGQR